MMSVWDIWVAQEEADGTSAGQPQHSPLAEQPSNVFSAHDEDEQHTQGAPLSPRPRAVGQAAPLAKSGVGAKADSQKVQGLSEDDDSREAQTQRQRQAGQRTDDGASMDVEMGDADWGESEGNDSAAHRDLDSAQPVLGRGDGAYAGTGAAEEAHSEASGRTQTGSDEAGGMSVAERPPQEAGSSRSPASTQRSDSKDPQRASGSGAAAAAHSNSAPQQHAQQGQSREAPEDPAPVSRSSRRRIFESWRLSGAPLSPLFLF